MHIGNLITKQVLHFLYNACGKWYFQSKISPFGLIQAGHTKLENGVSLSMGIVEKIWNMFCDQGANVHLWLNSRMFWFFRLTLLHREANFCTQRLLSKNHAIFGRLLNTHTCAAFEKVMQSELISQPQLSPYRINYASILLLLLLVIFLKNTTNIIEFIITYYNSTNINDPII